MTESRRTIEVELPDCLAMAPDDIEVLRTTFQTIITLASGGCDGPDEHLRAMRDQQWAVHWRLTWVAQARRDSQFEEAKGETKQQALAQLRRLTSLHEIEGTP
ncbi:MAG TPA: hypothetical protein PLL30_03630 [Candidatus Krumholzibacteria bacterium]|nr:hypothetical protein [Candidatus Krumholzibacteria bacterium]HPD70864.1 hypothetical protein [Candidatus Krumholzibacteria bacterium]HRY39436.1 hypothetical protein [Candidatus Krumholzibacteria bacterium]